MSDQESVTFNLELSIQQAYDNARKLEMLLYRALGLLKRLGLPENVEDAIIRVQRMVMTIRLLHSAMIALQAASGPIGWALAAVGIVSGGLAAYETISMEAELATRTGNY